MKNISFGSVADDNGDSGGCDGYNDCINSDNIM